MAKQYKKPENTKYKSRKDLKDYTMDDKKGTSNPKSSGEKLPNLLRKTDKEVIDSKILGELKLEKIVKKGIIIKPKLYILDDELKAKGIPIPKNPKDKLRVINKILRREEIFYQKFTKIKEGINRNIKVNSIQIVSKHLELEDNKRVCNNEYFNKDILEDS